MLKQCMQSLLDMFGEFAKCLVKGSFIAGQNVQSGKN